eukprot:13673949-Alexandrium_andersonii.AAC.1
MRMGSFSFGSTFSSPYGARCLLLWPLAYRGRAQLTDGSFVWLSLPVLVFISHGEGCCCAWRLTARAAPDGRADSGQHDRARCTAVHALVSGLPT